jgi:hypothetical protein|nr:MAG TPA: hypothetical protein [Caudoviricetes sp.]
MTEITTCEAYVLARLAEAERERDEAVAYCEKVREDEERRIAEAEETETVMYEVAKSYRLRDTDYELGGADGLRGVLALGDEELYAWARQGHKGKKWYSLTPIEKTARTYDYALRFDGGDGVETWVSDSTDPRYFLELANEPVTGKLLPKRLDAEARALAISELRVAIGEAIEKMEEES